MISYVFWANPKYDRKMVHRRSVNNGQTMDSSHQRVIYKIGCRRSIIEIVPLPAAELPGQPTTADKPTTNSAASMRSKLRPRRS